MFIYQKQYTWPMDESKNILNDVALEKVALIYQPLIMEIKNRYLNNARGRIHSLYLTGSVARGRAIPYKSDVNVYAILKPNDPGERLEWVENAEQAFKEKYSFVSAIELKFHPWNWVFPNEAAVFSDIAFNIKVHSVCIYGDDLAAKISNFKLSPAIANHFIIHAQSDIEEAIVDLNLDRSQGNLVLWCNKTIKSIMRAGYALLMHKENCFAWDLTTCKILFEKHYPDQVKNINKGFHFLKSPPTSITEFFHYLNSFGQWVIEESNLWLDRYNPERLLRMPLP